MVQWIVGVAFGTAIEVLLLSQPIPGVPGKEITFAVLVGQCLQAPIAVIAELHLPAMSVGAQAYLATSIVLVERGMSGRVGVPHELAADIALKQLDATVRQLVAE